MRAPARQALFAALLFAATLYWPLSLGRVPFPAEIILNFPPWESLRGGELIVRPHAEMADLAAQVYPWRLFAKAAVADGELPLWNPHVLLGVPFVAGAQTAVFYPPHLLYHLLPAPLAWGLLQALRTMLAVIFAAALARCLGAAAWAAVASGLAFAASGFMVAWQGWAHVDSAVWIPAVMAAVDRLSRRPDRRGIAVAAAAFAMPVLGGHPEAAVYAALAGLAMAALRLLSPAPEAALRSPMAFLLSFSAAAGLGMALAAVQLLPTLEWLPHLVRPLQFTWPPMPVERGLALLSRDLASSPNAAGFDIPEGAAYVGMLTLVVAPLGFAHRRRAEALFAALLLAASLQLSYGFGPVYDTAMRLPILRSMPHDRALALVGLSLALLLGLGLSVLGEVRQSTRRSVSLLAGAGFLGAALALAVLCARVLDQSPGALAGSFGLGSSWLALLASGALLVAGLRGGLRASSLATAALLLLAIDLGGAGFGHVPFFAKAEIYPEPPLVSCLRQTEPLYRTVSLDEAAPVNMEMVFGLHSPAGQEYVLRSSARLVAPFTGNDPGAFLLTGFRSDLVVTQPGRLLDLLGVKYLVTTSDNDSATRLAAHPERFRLACETGSVRVYENLHALPRAVLVPAEGVEVEADEAAVFRRLREADFDPSVTAIVAQMPAWPAASSDVPAETRLTRFVARRNSLQIEADVARASLLVLSETYFPGWKAEVDGTDQEVRRVDGALRGVALGPGQHRVTLAYEPRSFSRGLMLSIAGAVVAAGLALRWPRTRA